MEFHSVYLSDAFRTQIWPCFEQEFEGERRNTLKNYKNTLEPFCEYVRKDFLEVTQEDIQGYYTWLEGRVDTGDLSKRTMLTYKKNLRAIACAAERYIAQNRLSILYTNWFRKSIEGDVRQISEDTWLADEADVKKLLTKANGPKERLILLLLMEGALTPAQICSLTWEDIVRMDGQVYLLYKKKNYGFVMSGQMLQAYEEYGKEFVRSGKEAKELFRNRNGNLLNFKGISSLIKRCRAEAGLQAEITARQLRDYALLRRWKAYEAKEELYMEQVQQELHMDDMQLIRMRELAMQFPEQF